MNDDELARERRLRAVRSLSMAHLTIYAVRWKLEALDKMRSPEERRIAKAWEAAHLGEISRRASAKQLVRSQELKS